MNDIKSGATISGGGQAIKIILPDAGYHFGSDMALLQYRTSIARVCDVLLIERDKFPVGSKVFEAFDIAANETMRELCDLDDKLLFMLNADNDLRRDRINGDDLPF